MNIQEQVNNIVHSLADNVERIDNRRKDWSYEYTDSNRIDELEDKVDLLVHTIIELEKLLNK